MNHKPVNFQAAAAALREKLHASERYVPITDEEYRRLQCIQFEGVNRRQQEAAKPDYTRIGIREDEAGLDWGMIKPGISDGVKARDAVKPAYEKGFGMVLLYGNYGQAKTLIGKILTATALRDHKRAAYANVSAVLDDIRLAFDEREAKTTELLRRMDFWISRDVLFLDELDKSNDTPWAQERLFQLLDQRYARAIREEALTVLASNQSDDALDGYLKSRLRDRRLGPVVHLNGTDGRKVMPEGFKF
jgi:ATPase family protein associated with various cellular activities (AAA)